MIRLNHKEVYLQLEKHGEIINEYLTEKLQEKTPNPQDPFYHTHDLLKKYKIFQLTDVVDKRFPLYKEFNFTAEEHSLLKKNYKTKKVWSYYFKTVENTVQLYESTKFRNYPTLQEFFKSHLLLQDDFIEMLWEALKKDGLSICKKKLTQVNYKRSVLVKLLVNEKVIEKQYKKKIKLYVDNITFNQLESGLLDWLRQHNIRNVKTLKEYINSTAEQLFEYIQQLCKEQSIYFHLLDDIYQWISYPAYLEWFLKVYTEFSTESIKVRTKTKTHSAQFFIKNISLRICPYCNRNYIHNVEVNGKHYRKNAEIDHVLPKTVFPYLAICSYNLVPICSSCNFHKKDKVIFYSPYINSDLEEQLFRFSYSGGISGRFQQGQHNIRIQLESKDDGLNQLNNILHLEEMYNTHVEEAIDIFLLRNLYTDSRIDEIIRLLEQSKIVVTRNELYEMIFGIDIMKPDYIKRPLAKLRYNAFKFLE
jgi:hypothetical protein